MFFLEDLNVSDIIFCKYCAVIIFLSVSQPNINTVIRKVYPLTNISRLWIIRLAFCDFQPSYAYNISIMLIKKNVLAKIHQNKSLRNSNKHSMKINTNKVYGYLIYIIFCSCGDNKIFSHKALMLLTAALLQKT